MGAYFGLVYGSLKHLFLFPVPSIFVAALSIN